MNNKLSYLEKISESIYNECFAENNTRFYNDLINKEIIDTSEITKILYNFSETNNNKNTIYLNAYENIQLFSSKAPLYRQIIGENYNYFRNNLRFIAPFLSVISIKKEANGSEESINTYLSLLIIKERIYEYHKLPYDNSKENDVHEQYESVENLIKGKEIKMFFGNNDRLECINNIEEIDGKRIIYTFNEISNKLVKHNPLPSIQENRYTEYNNIYEKDLPDIRISKLKNNKDTFKHTATNKDVQEFKDKHYDEIKNHKTYQQLRDLFKIDSSNWHNFKYEIINRMYQKLIEKYGTKHSSVIQTVIGAIAVYSGLINLSPDLFNDGKEYYTQDNLRSKIKPIVKNYN